MKTYNSYTQLLPVQVQATVHKARGYTHLKNDNITMSRYTLHDNKTKKFYIVLKNTVCESSKALIQGSMVVESRKKFISDNAANYVDVQLIDCHKDGSLTLKNSANTYKCDLKDLKQLSSDVWHLIAGIQIPKERLELANNLQLCERLLKIKEGSFVRVKYEHDYCYGNVIEVNSIPRFGIGVQFFVKLSNKDETKKYFCASEILPASETDFAKEKFLKKDHCSTLMNGNLKNMIQKFETIAEKKLPFRKIEPGTVVKYFVPKVKQKTTNIGKVCVQSQFKTNSIHIHPIEIDCDDRICIKSDSYVKVHPDSVFVLDDNEDSPTIDNQDQIDCIVSSEQDISMHQVKVGNLLDFNNSFDKESCRNSNESLRRENNYINNDEYHSRLSRSEGCLAEANYSESPSFDYIKPSSFEYNNYDELTIGSMVEIIVYNESMYGVIKWIGKLGNNSLSAGIEMEEANPELNDGTYENRKIFECAPNRGFFTLLRNCKKDSRFLDSDYACRGDEQTVGRDEGPAVISGTIEPIIPTNDMSLFGKHKGIQGHNNSCYLDATLFAMFSFSSVFDSLLYRPASEIDVEGYLEVQRVLKEEIVNPLRRNHFVRASRVMKLRTLLDNMTSVTGLTCEEKDPEEFLTSLLAQVLKAESYLKLSSGHEAFYYQLFVEKDERLTLPNVQQLFEQSFISSDIKLKEVPSCLIIQMPRFGKAYKMYERILPSQILDVTNIIENTPRDCSVCSNSATWECKDCFKDTSHCSADHQLYSFCDYCVGNIHAHDKKNHKMSKIPVSVKYMNNEKSGVAPRHFMNLFAVVCIETSHYVAFVKCGTDPDTQWCFFDSMADRIGGSNGYNIPEMVLCTELPEWLSESGAQLLHEIKDEKHLPPYAKRLMCDAYMCMYQSTDVTMYR